MVRKPRSPLLAAFGRTIQERRDQLNMSQEQLAHKSGLHRSYISDIERGARNPSLSTVARISSALDMPASRLLQRAEQKMSVEVA